jgi:hypothetical protein
MDSIKEASGPGGSTNSTLRRTEIGQRSNYFHAEIRQRLAEKGQFKETRTRKWRYSKYSPHALVGGKYWSEITFAWPPHHSHQTVVG